jgi:FkbM family methyltransferase
MKVEFESSKLFGLELVWRKGCPEGPTITESYDADIQVRFEKHIGRGGAFIDIGGNYGFYSLLTRHFNQRVPIYYFDPNPFNFTCFKETARRNKWILLNHYCCAVGDSFETVQFGGVDWYTNSQLIDADMGQPVTIVPLDMTPAAQSRVGLIKIDAEGMDLHVLRGASLALEYRPVLIIEFCPEYLSQHGTIPRDILKFLANRNYEFEHLYVDQPNREERHRDPDKSLQSFVAHNTWMSNLFCYPM